MTLDEINNNVAFAPIGHEEAFKKRINIYELFAKCMTIRTFQKTAGAVVRKKLNTHPTAKIMNDAFNVQKSLIKTHHNRWGKTPFVIFYFQHMEDHRIKFNRQQYLPYNRYLSGFGDSIRTKNGNLVQERLFRKNNIMKKFSNKVGVGTGWTYFDYCDGSVEYMYGMSRIGFNRYMNAFTCAKKKQPNKFMADWLRGWTDDNSIVWGEDIIKYFKDEHGIF